MAQPNTANQPTSTDVAKRKPGRPSAHHGCQVCGADLSDYRLFHQRYHICEDHMMASQVVVKGVLQRFCQQCGRFHELERFAPSMRSCRQQLAKHAERRRRGRAMAAAVAAANGAGSRRKQSKSKRQSQPQLDIEQLQQLLTAIPTLTSLPMPAMPEPEGTQPYLPLSLPTAEQALQPHSPRRQQGSSQGGSSDSTHSTHRQGPSHPASPAPVVSGMEALLAAAEEEESAEQEQAQKRRRLSPEVDVAATAGPDLSWFQAPATAPQPAAAPLAAAASLAFPTIIQSRPVAETASGWRDVVQVAEPASSSEPQPSLTLPALAARLFQASAVPTPPQSQAPQQQHQQSDLQLLLHHLTGGALAAPHAAPPPPLQLVQQQPDGVGALPPALASVLSAMQLVQQEREREAAVQQQLLLAQQQQNKEEQLACLFKAAVSGIIAGLKQGAPVH